MTNKNPRQFGILEFYPLVKAIASQLVQRLPSCVDRDDLISIGVLGLIEAYDRFDVSKNVPFKSYAELRIRGAMIDYLRKQDWVPRSVRRRHDYMEQSKQLLEKHLKRKVSQQELANSMEMSLPDFYRYVRDAQVCHLVSIDTPVTDEQYSLHEVIATETSSPEEDILFKQRKQQLSIEIENLSSRERRAIKMYYYQRLNLKKIGQALGVSESRACQIRGAAIQNIRAGLARTSV